MRAAELKYALPALVVLWPFLLPGSLLARDMVVVPHMALTPQALGQSGAARATPQDAILGLVPFGLEPLAARAIILTCAFVGCRSAWRQFGPAAAILLAINPFVVERLLQGHWSLVAAWFLVPLLLRRDPPLWVTLSALWWMSLTPSGAVLGTIIACVCCRRPLLHLACGVAASLPWLWPSLSRPTALPTPESFAAFAPTSPLDLLTLGGIWNAEASPTLGFRWAGAAAALIVLLHLRQRRLWLLWAVGFLGASFLALLPAGEVLAPIPGAGLLRDGQKLVMLMLPAYLAAASRMRRPATIAWLVLWCAACGLAGVAVRDITPLPAPRMDNLVEQVGHRRLLILPGSTTVEWQGRTVVDPRSKVLDVLPYGGLTVDHVEVDPPSAEFLAAVADPGAYVGAVIDRELVILGPEPSGMDASRIVGIILLVGWLGGAAVLATSRRWTPR